MPGLIGLRKHRSVKPMKEACLGDQGIRITMVEQAVGLGTYGTGNISQVRMLGRLAIWAYMIQFCDLDS